MSSHEVVIWFVQSCARGVVPQAECGPVFAVGTIAIATLILTATLVVMVRLRVATEKRQSQSAP